MSSIGSAAHVRHNTGSKSFHRKIKGSGKFEVYARLWSSVRHAYVFKNYDFYIYISYNKK